MSSEPIESQSFEHRIKIQTRKKKMKNDVSSSSSSLQSKTKRANKNRPREMSSKQIPPSKSQFLVNRKIVDPRFDNLYGEFSEMEFKSNYGFVDEIKKKELDKLKRLSKKTKNEERRQEIDGILRREADRQRELKRVAALKEKVKAEKSQLAQNLSEGRSVRFKTKTESKLNELVNKFDALKQKGKLTKYIKKKTKGDRWA